MPLSATVATPDDRGESQSSRPLETSLRTPASTRSASNRQNPNFAVTWALGVSVPLFWAVTPFVPIVLVIGVQAVVSFALAYVDAERTRDVFGKRYAHPALATVSPLLYLTVRLLHDPDMRAGRPLWTAITLSPLVFFFELIAALGAYGMQVQGY